MVSPPRLLRALAAGLGTGVLALSAVTGVPGGPASAAAAAGAPQAQAAPDVVDDTPLRVRIDALAPSYLPETGQIRVSGTVTNRSRETWSGINLYTFLGNDLAPMQNPGDLADAMEEPADAYVGSIATGVGTPGLIDELAPGETARYTVRVPSSAFTVTAGGVYWFGVRAYGTGSVSGSDDTADGRARTFLPYVPRRVGTPVETSVVVPLTRALLHTADGRVDRAAEWQQTMSPGGRLADLLDFAEAADSAGATLTWTVDPALIDAVQQIAEGNPPRSLAPTIEPGGSPTATGEPLPDDETEGTDDETAPVEPDPATETPEARTAAAWLERLGDLLGDGQVLTTPYGDLDVPAAVRQSPRLLELALAQRSSVLADLGIEPDPVITAPTGFLDDATIEAAASLDDVVVLGTDRMVDVAGAAPAVADVDGQRVVLASSGASQGTPGPGPSQTAIGLRQRILAEAAVRAIKTQQEPLVVALPTTWGLDDADAFWDGLDVDWLELDTLDDTVGTTAAADVDPDRLVYPGRQSRRQLDAATFGEVDALLDAGDTLQNVLLGNADLAGVVTEEAMSGASYAMRAEQGNARGSLAGSRSWIEWQLQGVEIGTTEGVTLSGATGDFVVTLTNSLDQPVVVNVAAATDDGIVVAAPAEPVELAPGARTNVLMQAEVSTTRVHNVTLHVTDSEGTELGASESLRIRSAQVSAVIWVIMGTGAGILFLAIAVRLVRRIRNARRGGSPADADTDTHTDTGTASSLVAVEAGQ